MIDKPVMHTHFSSSLEISYISAVIVIVLEFILCKTIKVSELISKFILTTQNSSNLWIVDMETHLSSPYQNSAHVPVWTGPWINQKCTIWLCLQVSKTYEGKYYYSYILYIFKKTISLMVLPRWLFFCPILLNGTVLTQSEFFQLQHQNN